MNFCCHDDYTLVGKFTADHKNIYIAWQDWLTTFGPTDPLGTLEDFKNHYTLLESQGLVSGLISEVKKLPDHPSTDLDCADFTEQGEIFADDKNIFIAFLIGCPPLQRVKHSEHFRNLKVTILYSNHRVL